MTFEINGRRFDTSSSVYSYSGTSDTWEEVFMGTAMKVFGIAVAVLGMIAAVFALLSKKISAGITCLGLAVFGRDVAQLGINLIDCANGDVAREGRYRVTTGERELSEVDQAFYNTWFFGNFFHVIVCCVELLDEDCL